MNTSISTCNLLGGLCGGFAGILLAWYFNLILMPVGVLFGVVLGWWHAEIVQTVKAAHERAKRAQDGFVQVIGDAISWAGQSIGMPRWIIRMFRWVIAKAIIGSIAAIAAAPFKLYRFMREHPTNFAAVLQILVGFGVAIAFAIGAYRIPLSYGAKSSDTMLLALFALLIGFGASVIYQSGEESELKSLRLYYRHWEILSHYGPIGLSCYLAGIYVRYLAGLLLFATICICLCLPGMMIGFLAIYPILLVLGIPWGVFQLIKKSGHWLCFATTLITTFTSWLISRNSFENPLILWSVALLTGVVSGFLAELVRKLLPRFFEETKAGQWLSHDPWKHVLEGDHAYMNNLFDYTLGFGFQQHKVARVLRAICFGSPLIAE
jgi:hypothetical protein